MRERRSILRSHVYIAGIDGLRAIAVLSVLAYHIHPATLPGGFLGVDLFFVISGFVVSLTTSTLDARNNLKFFLSFYRRRIIRILPASLAVLLVTTLLATLFIPITSPLTATDMTGVAAVVGTANLMLWWTAGDYFSAATELNPFTHMWSLGVEEQFYVVFPLFATGLLLSHRRQLWNAATIGLALLCFLSLAIAAHTTHHAPAFAFYMLPARLWELSVGVLLFRAIANRPANAAPAWIALVSMIALGLLSFGLVAIGSTDFPFPGALAPVSSAALLIYVSTTTPKAFVARALAMPALRYVGRISFSLYLWHWPVIVLMRWTVGLDTAWLQIGAAVTSWLLADISYRYIEGPTRNSPILARSSDANIVFAGFGALFAAGVIVVGMIAARPYLSLSVTRDADVWMSSKLAEDGTCVVTRDKDALPHGGTRYIFRRADCPASKMGRLYVIGDSHAWGYQRMLGRVASESGRVVTVMMAPGCTFLPGYRNPDPGVNARCTLFLKTAFAALPSNLGRGDILFLPGLRVPRYREFSDPTFAAKPADRDYSDTQLAAEAAKLSSLFNRQTRVIVEAPKPVYRYAPLRCSDVFNKRNRYCLVAPVTRTEALARRASVVRTFQKLRAKEPRLEIWDPFPTLCRATVCTPIHNNKPLVSDGDHLSGYANDLLYSDFAVALNRHQ